MKRASEVPPLVRGRAVADDAFDRIGERLDQGGIAVRKPSDDGFSLRQPSRRRCRPPAQAPAQLGVEALARPLIVEANVETWARARAG